MITASVTVREIDLNPHIDAHEGNDQQLLEDAFACCPPLPNSRKTTVDQRHDMFSLAVRETAVKSEDYCDRKRRTRLVRVTVDVDRDTTDDQGLPFQIRVQTGFRHRCGKCTRRACRVRQVPLGA